jgi:NADH:quinone reductase (non-electrogenic)
MAKDFRNFDPASARILLVQAGPRVLPQFGERLSAVARSSLEAPRAKIGKSGPGPTAAWRWL